MSLRVCLISYEFPPAGGGEASYVSGLATGLSKLGHEVLVLAPDSARPMASGLPFTLIPVGQGRLPIRGAGFLAEAESQVSSLAKRGKIDIAHVTFDYPTFIIRLQNATVSRGAPVSRGSLKGTSGLDLSCQKNPASQRPPTASGVMKSIQ